MKLFPAKNVHYQEVDPEHFTGEASVGRVFGPDQGGEARIYRVCFQPRARTDWHIHTGLQLLYVEEGKGRVQKVGEEVLEIGPGDTVCVRPGEKHWHGASPEGPMTHLAINVGGRTEWMNKVTEEEYSQ